jgi:hypothetical protein
MQPRIGKWALRSGFPKDEIPALAAQYAVGHSVESLIEIGHRSKATGFYMPDDFSVICRSARNNRNCDVNSARKIEKETRISLSTNSEQERVYSLMRLSGVSWSTASLILHYTFEDQYPILAQESLWSWGYDEKPDQTFNFWWAYVKANRDLRSECGVTMQTLNGALRQFALNDRTS